MTDIDRRSFLRVGAGSLTFGAVVGGRLSHVLPQGRPTGSRVVETAAGKLRGVLFEGVTSCKGVSYGASTAGPGRFMPSVKSEPWTGVRDAFAFGPRSP